MRAVSCRRALPSIEPASGAAEAQRWAVPHPVRSRACACRAASAAAWVPDRAAGARGAHARLRWAGAIGCGARRPARCRRPYSPRVPPACAVGARPPPRGHGRRPTALAADTAGAAENLGVFYTRVMCRRAPRSINPASGAAEAGRWAVPHPVRSRACAWSAASAAAWAGSRRGSVGGFLTAAAGGRRRVRRAAGQRGAAGHSRRAYRPHVWWAPARRPAAHLAAQPRSQQTPLARPGTWALCRARPASQRAPRCMEPASGAAEAGVGRSLSPSVVRPGVWRAARTASVVPTRAAVMWGAHARLRWAGAIGRVGRGGQDSVRLPVSPRPRPPIAVGARPPPRCPCRRPTALAADTAGAAPNLGVFYDAVACRHAPRSSEPASGAAEAGVGRSLAPSVVRPCGWHATSAATWGPDRAAVTWDARERCVGRAPSVAWGAAGRTRYACRYRRAHARMGGGRPPAAPLLNQPPNIARSRHRWRGRQPGRCV